KIVAVIHRKSDGSAGAVGARGGHGQGLLRAGAVVAGSGARGESGDGRGQKIVGVGAAADGSRINNAVVGGSERTCVRAGSVHAVRGRAVESVVGLGADAEGERALRRGRASGDHGRQGNLAAVVVVGEERDRIGDLLGGGDENGRASGGRTTKVGALRASAGGADAAAILQEDADS